MQLETPDDVASAVSRSLAIHGDLSGIEALYTAYESLTPEDIRSAAREVLVPSRRTVGLLKPEQ